MTSSEKRGEEKVDFYGVLDQVLDLLRTRRRVTYRALKRHFDVDDAFLEDLKDDIIKAQKLAIDEDGEVLVWTGEPCAAYPRAQDGADAETHFHTLLAAIILLLQRDKRVTYRTLKWTFGIDDVCLREVQEELSFTQLARDEDGKGLVWAGEAPAPMPPHVTRSSQPPFSTPVENVAADMPPLPSHITEANTRSIIPTASLEALPPDASPDEPMATPAPTRQIPEAERRQLTVMFCDLVGSTDLSGTLDPEDLREVVRAYQETAAEIIHRYEGHIAQYLGDGLLIYFGFPVAHEDDARRAVYTGWGIPEAMAHLNVRLQADYNVELAVRIGIHTGTVVVGEMGGGGRHENLALGETPNIAARLEGLAPPNTAVISPVTAQLVQRTFVLEDLGAHALKGVAEPMRLFAVVAPREVEHDDPEAMMTSGFDALVGRDEEIGLLLRRWEQSKAGLGQVVLMSGEAGIGKTSLVDGLREHVRQEELTRITFRCSPYHRHSALYPIIAHVQRVLDWQPDDTVETQLVKLEQALEGTSLAPEEAIPLLAALFSLPLPEGRYPTLTLSSQQQRHQTQDALVTWLLEEAERQPVLAVWENLHWADPSTLEILGLFVDQAPTATMLQVLTFRPEFEPPWPPRSHVTPLTLNRLERPQVEAMITRLARGNTLPAEVVEHIVTKTDGVPLFVEELTKMLLDSDLLREAAGHYELTGPLSGVAIPDTLQDSLMARLDQLNTAKDIAQLGAVLGREFSYAMLQALSTLAEARLQEGLAQLVAAELLYQRGRPPRARYIFKHALIQDAAYASLLRSTRQRYHQQIVEMLETRFPEVVTSQPEVVAHHALQAELWALALAYLQRAAEQRAQTFANREAVALYDHALEVADHLGQAVEDTTLMAIHQAQADVLFVLSDFVRARAEGERCLALAQRAGERRREAAALAGMGMAALFAHNFDQALADARQTIAVAEEVEAAEIQVAGHLTTAYVHAVTGRLAEARKEADQTLGISQAADDVTHQALSFYLAGLLKTWEGAYDEAARLQAAGLRIAQAHNLVVLLLRLFFGYGVTLTSQGQYDMAHATLQEGLALSDKVGDEVYGLRLLNSIGWLYSECGDFHRALDVNRRGAEGARKRGDPETSANAELNLGDIFLAQGDLALAYDCLDSVYRMATNPATSDWMKWRYSTHLFVSLGEYWLARGDFTQAAEFADRCLEIAIRTTSRKYVVRGQRLRGEIALAQHQWEEAENWLRQALSLARTVGNPPQLWKSYLAMGQLQTETQQSQLARESYQAARNVIDHIKMTLQDSDLRMSLDHSPPIQQVYDLSAS